MSWLTQQFRYQLLKPGSATNKKPTSLWVLLAQCGRSLLMDASSLQELAANHALTTQIMQRITGTQVTVFLLEKRLSLTMGTRTMVNTTTSLSALTLREC
jgi:hypothetical protein